MKTVELRDLGKARDYILASMAMSRSANLTPERITSILRWSLEVLSQESCLPPVGWIADVGQVLSGVDRFPMAEQRPELPGWKSARAYDDVVLGKLVSDWTIERAADTIKRYEPAERPRGVAYVIRQICQRLDIGCLNISPAVVRNLHKENPLDVFNQVMAMGTSGATAQFVDESNDLVMRFRRSAELLGPDDLAALDHRMALADSAQYFAHRQIVRLVQQIDSRLPQRPVRPRTGRRDLPTKVTDENVYPVGGYSSIGTKGSIESLLQSQLAFLESGKEPDLFAIRFVRDELFYYTRDENQFLRRRRTFVIRLDAALERSRFKDEQSPVQRIIFVIAAVLSLIHKLEEWLTVDALSIELIFPPRPILEDEFELLSILLRESILRNTVQILRLTESDTADRLDQSSHTQEIHVLTIGIDPKRIEHDGMIGCAIDLAEANPIREDGHGDFQTWPDEDSESAWVECVRATLEDWV